MLEIDNKCTATENHNLLEAQICIPKQFQPSETNRPQPQQQRKPKTDMEQIASLIRIVGQQRTSIRPLVDTDGWANIRDVERKRC